ncbi:MAG: branched-chain amino acid ABC transporter permease [Armatimonadota bacterium]
MKQFLKRWYLHLILLVLFGITMAISLRSNTDYPLLNPYFELILIYIGINIILTVSLNLVNGYMGEFSVGHAGFMAIGAYVAAVLTVQVFPREAGPFLFPVALLAGGAVAGIAGLVLAFPSFRTRGDYLAIVTLAFNMIVRNGIENVEALGGPRGYLGIDKLTTLAWIFALVVGVIYLARNFVYSNFGRGVLAIREDETAAGLVGVNTRQVKVLTFVFSAFLAGIAGGLFAHTLQFINPKSFTILKSTEMLVMVYLGGVGSLGGSILGATIFTVVMEGLRSLLKFIHIGAEWRQVVMPLLLILLMLFRPRGIMGMREFPFLVPLKERFLRRKGLLVETTAEGEQS